jgi:hypothetical protein
MPFPGSDPDNLLIKQSATAMLLQALIAELLATGTLNRENLEKIKERALSYAEILKQHGGSGAQVAGARIQQDLRMVFDILSDR